MHCMGKYKGFYRKTPPPGASKRTSIVHYSLFYDRIILEFKGGELYTYSYESTGVAVVEAMRSLAKSGQGLNRYLNETKPDFILGAEYSDRDLPRQMETYGGN